MRLGQDSSMANSQNAKKVIEKGYVYIVIDELRKGSRGKEEEIRVKSTGGGGKGLMGKGGETSEGPEKGGSPSGKG